jgi:hypothetical protein
MNASINVQGLFGGRPFPTINRGNEVKFVQKILKRNHVSGIPNHWPKMYYGQARENLALNRTYRNTNAHSLPDGAYLYLIEFNPKTNRYHKSFVRVLNRLEAGSRHFQLPTLQKDRVIVAAGELSKKGSVVQFNLESGTYTKNLMIKTKNYMGEANYVKLVKNALRNVSPSPVHVRNILVPQIPGNLKNLMKSGSVSFYFGEPSLKTKERILKELKKVGLTTNSAENLVRQLALKRPRS